MAGGRDIIRSQVLNRRAQDIERATAIAADEKARTKAERKSERTKGRPSVRRKHQSERVRPPIQPVKNRRTSYEDKMVRSSGDNKLELAGITFATPEARELALRYGMDEALLGQWAPGDLAAGFSTEDVEDIHGQQK